MRASDRNLIYGVFTFDTQGEDGQILFLKRRDAVMLTEAWAAAARSKTWGDFRSLVKPAVYKRIYGMSALWESTAPEPHTPFDRSVIMNEESNLDTAAVDLLPDEVLELGERADTPGMGDWVTFKPAQEHSVVSRLRSLGYTVARDDQRVRDAGGDWIAQNFGP